MNRSRRALDNVQNQPRQVVDWAQALLDDPSSTSEERASAAWALGRAFSELDQVDRARQALQMGIDLATTAELVELGAEIRVSLSACLLTSGNAAEARSQLEQAESHLVSDGSRGRLVMQRGFVAMHLGDLEGSMRLFDQALGYLDGGADELARTRLLVNRGIANTMTGRILEGERDFAQARALAEQLDQHMLAAGAAQNLGFVAGRKGDLPAALSWFARARSAYEEVGSPTRAMSLLEYDHSTVLLAGGLYVEAARSARRAARLANTTGNRMAEAEALLLLARIGVADGLFVDAEGHAARAAELFRLSDRQPWVAIADYVSLQAAAQSTEPNAELLHRAMAIVEALDGSGWRREALEARTFAGRTAVALGRLTEARLQLRQVAEAGHAGSSSLRVTAWLATATLQLADNDRAGAKAALNSAMETVEEHRASLGSTELRAHASTNGTEVAELGLRLAIEDGEPAEIFRWAERWRAGGLQVTPIRPEPTSRLAAALVELREAHGAIIEGSADPFDDDADARVDGLEREIRDLSRASGAVGNRRRQLNLERLQNRLGPNVMIEFLTVENGLHALTISGGGAAIHELVDVGDIEPQLRRLTATLSRLAYHDPEPVALRSTEAAILATATMLDEQLITPLKLATEARLIIIPTRILQAMPWALLPSLRLRPTTVAPSGWLWAGDSAEIGDEVEGGGRALLACGPELPGAREEIDRLAELYDDPIVLVDGGATVVDVLDAMAQVQVAHIAAHGSFRADNPMFSALDLHDGPLTVYDLEGLASAPRTVVLPACNAARSSVKEGDELLGTAAALLQGGVGTVIAPVTVVPDSTVVPELMIELHRGLVKGLTPDVALVEARIGLDATFAAIASSPASAFVTIGSRR